MGDCTDCKYRENMCKWPCDDCVKGDKWEERPLTNADRLNAMTVEEKAAFFASLPCCPPGPDAEELCFPEPGDCGGARTLAYKCWLNWLQQEVKDGKEK